MALDFGAIPSNQTSKRPGAGEPSRSHEPQRPGGYLRQPRPYAKADPLYEQALAIREEALGPEYYLKLLTFNRKKRSRV